jgi:thioester reductase-like protein
VGVAQGWNASLGPYPEQVILDGRYATGSGYGEAKYVCERILATSELETTSIRISQMVGREKNGAWSSYDWVPIMFQSSAALGGLPTASGTISWISPDTVAGVIIDLANYTESYPQALNIINPQPITWNDMVRNIQQAMQLECGIHLPLIPYEDWFSALEHSASSVQDTKDIIRIPAIKLVNFFDHLARKNSEDSQPGETEAFNFPTFSTDKCTTISGTLAAQPPLSKHDIYQWVQYWAKNGILPRV